MFESINAGILNITKRDYEELEKEIIIKNFSCCFTNFSDRYL